MTTLSDKLTRGTVPLSNLPERTEWVDDSVLDILGANSLGAMAAIAANQKPTGVTFARGMSYKDSNGEYFFRFQVQVTCGTATDVLRFWFTGLTSVPINNEYYSINAEDTFEANGQIKLSAKENDSRIFIRKGGASTATVTVSGDVRLSAKPTWFDANREAGFSINAQVEEATDTTAGLVKATKFQSKTMPADVAADGGTKTLITMNGLTPGKSYRVTCSVAFNQTASNENYNFFIAAGGGSTLHTFAIGNNNVVGTQCLTLPAKIITATDTSFVLKGNGLDSPSTYLGAPSAGSTTFMDIEQLSSHTPTTDFT